MEEKTLFVAGKPRSIEEIDAYVYKSLEDALHTLTGLKDKKEVKLSR